MHVSNYSSTSFLQKNLLLLRRPINLISRQNDADTTQLLLITSFCLDDLYI